MVYPKGSCAIILWLWFTLRDSRAHVACPFSLKVVPLFGTLGPKLFDLGTV